MTFFVVIIMKNQVPDQPEKVFQRGKLAHHFTFFFLGVGHQVIRVRIDPMFGPPSSCVCVCVWMQDGGPRTSCRFRRVVRLSVFWKGRRLKRRRGGGALNSTGPPLLGV